MCRIRWLTRFKYALHNWWHFGILSARECTLVAHVLNSITDPVKKNEPTGMWVIVSEAPDCVYLTYRETLITEFPELRNDLSGLVSVVYRKRYRKDMLLEANNVPHTVVPTERKEYVQT